MLASTSDIEARLGRVLTSDEAMRVEALIEDVSALIVAYTRKDFSESVPPEVKAVACSEVIRMFNANPGILAEEIGEIRTQYAAFYQGLSSAAKAALGGFRRRAGSVPIGQFAEGHPR